MWSKKPDRAMELLRAHLLSKFVIPPSDLSPDDIFSRQGRAEADNLTPQERGFKEGLLQGVLPLTKWTSAREGGGESGYNTRGLMGPTGPKAGSPLPLKIDGVA